MATQKQLAKKIAVYTQVVTEIFRRRRKGNSFDIPFDRADISRVADELRLKIPKNLGDLIYTFRFRKDLPEEIRSVAPKGLEWVIRLAGDAKYRFTLTSLGQVRPNPQMMNIKIPDATPGIIERYAQNDEQALLAIVRYNRLLDIFTGVTCYALQSHLRTKVEGIGQCEIDELYVGVDRSGTHYVLPVQAKGGNDKLGAVQIEQDMAVCRDKFPQLVCRPIGAQFLGDSVALFEFMQDEKDVRIARECHYKLVPHTEISDADLDRYKQIVGNEK
ncbi:MAG: hypothetical protein WC058_08705 [Phycisphaeraceae bacterium]